MGRTELFERIPGRASTRAEIRLEIEFLAAILTGTARPLQVAWRGACDPADRRRSGSSGATVERGGGAGGRSGGGRRIPGLSPKSTTG